MAYFVAGSRPSNLFARIMRKLAEDNIVSSTTEKMPLLVNDLNQRVALAHASPRIPTRHPSSSQVGDAELQQRGGTKTNKSTATTTELLGNRSSMSGMVGGAPLTPRNFGRGTTRTTTGSTKHEGSEQIRSSTALEPNGYHPFYSNPEADFPDVGRFRIFCCLVGVSQLEDVPFWQIIQKASMIPPLGEECDDLPLELMWNGKLIQDPTLYLGLDMPNFRYSYKDTNKSSDSRRTFAFKSFYQTYVRLEQEDLSRARSDILKLSAPDIYYTLYIFFSFKVEILLPNRDNSDSVVTMYQLCQSYINACLDTETSEQIYSPKASSIISCNSRFLAGSQLTLLDESVDQLTKVESCLNNILQEESERDENSTPILRDQKSAHT